MNYKRVKMWLPLRYGTLTMWIWLTYNDAQMQDGYDDSEYHS